VKGYVLIVREGVHCLQKYVSGYRML
jgi:hypothetical protein